MKFKPRTPSIKKSVKARTTGRVKRAAKRSVNPTYGKKGAGWVKDPKRAARNKVYHATTYDTRKVGSGKNRGTTSRNHQTSSEDSGCLLGCLGTLCFISFISMFFNPVAILITVGLIYAIHKITKKQEIEKKERLLYQQEKEKYTVVAQRHLEIYEDSQKLITETVNPEVFFERYDLAQEQLIQLNNIVVETDNIVGYRGDDLEEKIQLYDDMREEAHQEFITRYHEASVSKAMKLKTERGRKNNYQRSYEKLLGVEDKMSEETKRYLEDTWEKVSF